MEFTRWGSTRWIAWLGVALLVSRTFTAQTLTAATLEIHYRSGMGDLVLDSQDARQQLLATADGRRDVTREVAWSAEPQGIVRIDPTGRVLPVADGAAVITAKTRDGSSTASLPVKVVHANQPAPLHFANQSVPIFTKNGCNGGGCHGKWQQKWERHAGAHPAMLWHLMARKVWGAHRRAQGCGEW